MPKYQTDCCKFNLERSTDPKLTSKGAVLNGAFFMLKNIEKGIKNGCMLEN
ncbi:hypothetical protein PUND_b0170 [Pseudoalteromonas undina]|nr:hypothetical protein PUND_b0170 [Pseudoalteromonas undina]